MARHIALALALISACCDDHDSGAPVAGETSSSSTTDEPDASSSSDAGSEESSSTGDPDACPDWCDTGCPYNTVQSGWSRQGLCACRSSEDCDDDGVLIGYQCQGYDPGVEPNHEFRMGRCMPLI